MAISIFDIVIMAWKARSAMAGSEELMAWVRSLGVICHEIPHLSLHHPHWLAWPPFSIMEFQ